tara:strand:+ start:238 stop:1401 length:1164 start_codon:yes stop_codon:yes gene_type:complete
MYANSEIYNIYSDKWLSEISNYSPKKINELKEDLKNDRKGWNAYYAADQLIKLIQHNMLSINNMEQLLYSDDHQQRQYAAWIIKRAVPYYDSPILYEIIVESLKNDNIPWDWKNGGVAQFPDKDSGDNFYDPYFYNATMAIQDLMQNYSWYATEPLINGLYSEDKQLSFFSAVILAENQIIDAIERTVEVLCDNLKDDKIPHNGCMAFSALYNLGKSSCQHMYKHYQISEDEQEKESILLLWKYLEFVPDEWDQINFESFNKLNPKFTNSDYFLNYNRKIFILGQKKIMKARFDFPEKGSDKIDRKAPSSLIASSWEYEKNEIPIFDSHLSNYIQVVIVHGETLSDIARQYVVSEETIKLTNSKIKFPTDGNLDSLIGSKLLIPKEL